MFEKILLPLDGSEAAEVALLYGEELVKKLGSELVLFHVCGPEHKHYLHMHETYLNTLAGDIRRSLEKDQPSSTKIKVTTRIEIGGPQENVCALVQQNDIDLIIMSSIGHSGIKVGKMMGSVADHICRTVPTPVLLVRPQKNHQIEAKKQLISHILLTLDGSELSRLALPVGEELATKLKIPITLFQMAHLIIPMSEDGTALDVNPFYDYTKLNEDVENLVNTEMAALEKKLREKDLNATHLVVSGVSAADEIIEASKKVGADLVVMSTHGRSGLGRWVIGGVAEKIIRHSGVPVLLVNARAN
jgi:nucleotide-binding universal stress UspA family protein